MSQNITYTLDDNWSRFSLIEQLGNIGSEVGRARIAQYKDEEGFQNAIKRALELFDRTLSDLRWSAQRPEIETAREIFCDAISGGQKYRSNLDELEEYFMYFAIAAMRQYDS